MANARTRTFRRLVLPVLISMVGAGLFALLPRVSAADQGPKKHGGFVVHFGDSFVNSGLQQNLRKKFASVNTRYVSFGKAKAWFSTWAFGKDLDDLYWGYRPALFLITLGANELPYRPVEKKAPAVRQIVKRLRGTPCVWISIPLWEGAKPDIVDMTRRECGPCRHFDSSKVAGQMSRQADGRHPSKKGGQLWADEFWKWLQKERDPSQGPWALKPAPRAEHAP